MSFISCDKEKEKISILSADVEGESINLAGNAARYRDLKDEVPFGFGYYIWNLESPALFIEAYDSSYIENDFIYPVVKAKYSFMDSANRSWNFTSIGGSLKITNERNGVLFGTFNFIFTNNLDETDTLKIDKGHFEITLDEYDRFW